MKTRRVLIPVLVVVAIAVVAVVVRLVMNPLDTTLEFQVRDAVSGDWVWDATFALQNRVIRAYYQSDRGPVSHTFTRLEPGDAWLEISAPSYVSQTVPVSLKRGANRLEEPIDLVGYEIPGLAKFVITEQRVGGDVAQEIRPVSSEGPAVLNHPCLDLWIGARISAQVQIGPSGVGRGEELFKGVLELAWDPSPESTFHYSSRIPGSQIKPSSDPYWVIDYLIIVPDPRQIKRAEIAEIMNKAWDLPPAAIQTYLEPHTRKGTLIPYTFTSWKVGGAGS